MTKDEALKMALTTLENVGVEYDFHGKPVDTEFGEQLETTLQAIRQALAEPDMGIDRGAWSDVPDVTKWVDELRGDNES